MTNILSLKSSVDISTEMAKKVKQQRLALNLTQIEMADKSGVSLGSIKRFENTAQISLKNLLKIAIVLNETEGFLQLFTAYKYSNIQEVIDADKRKTRKRARK